MMIEYCIIEKQCFISDRFWKFKSNNCQNQSADLWTLKKNKWFHPGSPVKPEKKTPDETTEKAPRSWIWPLPGSQVALSPCTFQMIRIYGKNYGCSIACYRISVHPCAKSKSKEPKEPSLVEVVTAKDFSLASFQVVINRIQQMALDKASQKIPCPEDQLELIRQRRSKKSTKERSKLSTYSTFCSCNLYILQTTYDGTSWESRAKEFRDCWDYSVLAGLEGGGSKALERQAPGKLVQSIYFPQRL